MSRNPGDARGAAGGQEKPAPPRPGSGPNMSPGDEAPAGTPGTGETLCRRCAGSGTVDGQPCPDCEGSGRVIAGIGGA